MYPKIVMYRGACTLGSECMAPDTLFRGGCAIYLTVKNHFPNLPETANVPEDGTTLHVQNAQNRAI